MPNYYKNIVNRNYGDEVSIILSLRQRFCIRIGSTYYLTYFLWLLLIFKMNQGQPQSASKNQTPPGFCSATCIDRTSLQQEISKPELKTSDMFATCNLPKRFEHPRKCLTIFTIIYLFCQTIIM